MARIGGPPCRGFGSGGSDESFPLSAGERTRFALAPLLLHEGRKVIGAEFYIPRFVSGFLIGVGAILMLGAYLGKGVK